MRRVLLSSTLAFALLSVLLSGCTDDTHTPTPDDVNTVLTLELRTMDATVEGGDYSVGYTLTNGYDGISPKAICDAEWISNIATTDSAITFTVQANQTPEPRNAILKVTYPGIENQTIGISQLGGESPFNMVISNKTSTTCQSTVVATDPEMAYIVYLSGLDYFYAAGITTAEQLFEDDYNYFKSLAQEHDTNLGQFMIINQIAFYGQSDIAWTGIIPNKEYVLYAYGIEFNDDMTDYKMITPVSYIMLSLDSGTLRDIEFDVTVTIDGPEAFYEFEPIGWSGKYYIDIYAEGDYLYLPEGETPSEAYCKTVVDNWLAIINQHMASGYSGEQLINIMCLEGKDSYSEIRLANTKYMMSFYAIDLIDGIPQVVSRPYLVHFQTEPVTASDMTFDVNVDKVYTRVADIEIKPSNDHDPYTIALVLKSDVPEGSNTDIINWLTGTFGLTLYEGNISTHLNTLDPETEYSLLIFGYYGGVVTTDLHRVDFKTDAEGVAENSVVGINFMGPYSPTELARHYPNALNGMEAMYEQYGFYVMWAEIVTEKPSNDVFFYHYEPKELIASESAVFDELVSYASDHIQVLTARSGVEFVMCGVTMDYRGNYSDMWVSEPFIYEYNTDTKRPIEELLEKLEAK